MEKPNLRQERACNKFFCNGAAALVIRKARTTLSSLGGFQSPTS